MLLPRQAELAELALGASKVPYLHQDFMCVAQGKKGWNIQHMVTGESHGLSV